MQGLKSHVEHQATGPHCDRQRPEGSRKAFLNLYLKRTSGAAMSSSLEQLQVVVAEVQAARQQVGSVRAQVQELANTIEAVKAQPENLSLHRQLGGVLVEVADRDALVVELEASQQALNLHLKRFEERELQLVATYDELKKSLEGASE